LYRVTLGGCARHRAIAKRLSCDQALPRRP
jgi:hypothetical protein